MIGLSGLGLDTTEVRVLLDPQVSFTSYVLEAEAYASALRAEGRAASSGRPAQPADGAECAGEAEGSVSPSPSP